MMINLTKSRVYTQYVADQQALLIDTFSDFIYKIRNKKMFVGKRMAIAKMRFMIFKP